MRLPLLLLTAGAVLPAQEAKPAYAGSESCQACHEDIHKAFEKNKHAILEKEKGRGWVGQACESCHGPGAKHAESLAAADILHPQKLSPGEADRACLKCHLNTPTHIGRIRGSHAHGQVACVACHSIHSTEAATALRLHPKAKINRECSECHSDVWESFQRPHVHPLPQDVMSCVDCHNPHGSFLAKNLQTVAANEPGCLKCHGDKRGPFVFEHAPIRLEGCAACHDPHGSTNPRMLNRHDTPTLCLECHTNIFSAQGASSSGALGGIAPGFHDLRSARFRNCTMCHMKVHGSQVNRDFLR